METFRNTDTPPYSYHPRRSSVIRESHFVLGANCARYESGIHSARKDPAGMFNPLSTIVLFPSYCWIVVSALSGFCVTCRGLGSCERSHPPPNDSTNATADVISST